MFSLCPVFILGSPDILDTLDIDEVHISLPRNHFYTDDINLTKIDTLSLDKHSNLSLGELLSITSNIHVHSNGKGGFVAGAFIRGTNSYQTSVNWNGFPVNPSTLGTYDLSTVNPGMIQNITINYGASASLYGTGTFGGAIDLDNHADWDNTLKIKINGSAGNINEYR